MLSLMNVLLAQSETQSIFGEIKEPPGVDKFNSLAGAGANNIGLILFISNIIKLATVIAGIWVMFNFIMAGYIYITSNGDSGAHNKVKDQFTSSIMGLIIIVGSYTVIALISAFLFGRPDYILNPTIQGPGQ